MSSSFLFFFFSLKRAECSSQKAGAGEPGSTSELGPAWEDSRQQGWMQLWELEGDVDVSVG